MIEQTSAEAIGKYGYAHYSGKPATPGDHDLYLVPQSIADGWEGFCTCGEWRAFDSFENEPSREAMLARLKQAFKNHVG